MFLCFFANRDQIQQYSCLRSMLKFVSQMSELLPLFFCGSCDYLISTSFQTYFALNVLTHPVTLSLLTHAEILSSRRCGGSSSVNLHVTTYELKMTYTYWILMIKWVHVHVDNAFMYGNRNNKTPSIPFLHISLHILYISLPIYLHNFWQYATISAAIKFTVRLCLQ